MRALAIGLLVMIECERTPYEYPASDDTEGTTSTGMENGSTTTSSGGQIADSASESSGSSGSSSTGPDFFQCDVVAQDCPLGEKCTYWSSDGSRLDGTNCVAVSGDPAGLGEPCTAEENPLSGLDDCGLGMMCLLVDPVTLQGRCLELCGGETSQSECPEEYQCVVSSGGQYPGSCRPTCDPLDVACDANETCLPTNGSFLCIPVLLTPAAVGEDCESVNACEPGSLCADPEVAAVCDSEPLNGCCVPFCDVNDRGTTCADFDPTTTCVPWFEVDAAPPQYAHVGVCVLPR